MTTIRDLRLLDDAKRAPALRAGAREHLEPVGEGLFRVVDAGDRILGHLRVVAHELGERFLAQRFSARRGGFLPIGAFWNVNDAIASLRGTG